MRFHLIRHGEVESRYHRVFGGRIDMDLSPRGHEQVAALAKYCHPLNIERIYASPMKRVQQTLAPLAELTGHLPVIIPGLREVDFGAWTGLSWDSVKEKFGVSAFEWLDLLESGGIAEAETVPDFRYRVETGFRQIVSEFTGESAAIICHGGVIRMLLSVILDLPFRQMGRFDVEYASLTTVRYGPPKTEVELLNFTAWRDLPL
jgi:broad specificity phosphatase PhoE